MQSKIILSACTVLFAVSCKQDKEITSNQEAVQKEVLMLDSTTNKIEDAKIQIEKNAAELDSLLKGI